MTQVTYSATDPDSTCCEILRRSYEAFNARDVEAALVCMDPDVDWPNALEGGYLYGHKAVHDYWARQWHMVDPHVEPVGYSTDEEGNIVVEVHVTVSDLEGNVIVEETVQHVYLVLQGLIKRMEIRKMAAVSTPADTLREEADTTTFGRVAPAGGERMAAMATADTAAAVNATVARNAAATMPAAPGLQSRVEPAA